jgi:hypothetical protein
VQNPAQGMPHDQACVAAQQVAPAARQVTASSPDAQGCLSDL